MPRILQSKFNQGEFSPEMLGRSDVDQYYGAAETLTNVVVIPQGGVKRRDGTKYIDTLLPAFTNLTPSDISAPNGGTKENADDFDTTTTVLTTVNLSTLNPYVVLQYDFGSDIFINFVHVCNMFLTVSGVSTNDFFIEASTDAAPTTWFANSIPIDLTTTGFSTRRGIAGNFRHLRLVKTTGTDLGTNRISLTEMNVYNSTTTVSETREMAFEFNKEQTYNMVFTDRNIAIYEDEAFQANIPAPEFTSDKLSEINWTQSADTAIVVHEDIPPHVLIRGDTSADWTFNPVTFFNQPIFDFTPTSSNPAGTITPSLTDGVITITASGAPFTDSDTDVNQIIDGGGGRARIIQFLTTSTVKAVVIIPFFDVTAIPSGEWVYETGFEDAWSVAQGWPKSCTFHDGRLWFGGSRELPQTLWASKVGLFFDFDKGQVSDNDAIEVTLDTDQVNEIVNLFSQRTLQVFTSGAEFAILQSTGVAITASNIDIRRQTQEGSEKGIRPSSVEGSTIFLKRNGAAVLEFIFSDVEQAYSSTQLTVASSHLIISPVDMAIDRSNTDNDASLLYVVNSDGTMAVGSILKGQNVLAFTRFTTPHGGGKYKNISVDAGGTWAVVERTIDGSIVRFVEKFDNTLLMDAAFSVGGVVNGVSGVTWLEGETIKLRVDDVNVPDVNVLDGTETGSIVSFTDYTGTVPGAVLVTTSVAHNLLSNHDVVISGTTNYNATEKIIVVSSTSYYIIAPFLGDDATGIWTGVAGVVPVFPTSTTSVEFGLNFTTEIKDLPVEVAAQTVRIQSSVGKKKRISTVNLRVIDTSGITVNGNTTYVEDFSATGANNPITNFTGIAKVSGISDYTDTGQVTIAQAEPNPLTLLSTAKEVNF